MCGRKKKEEAPAGGADAAKEGGAASGAAESPAMAKKGCCGRGAAPEPDWGMLPNKRRKCRDVFCCLLFLVFWAGMLIVGIIGLKFGNWMRCVPLGPVRRALPTRARRICRLAARHLLTRPSARAPPLSPPAASSTARTTRARRAAATRPSPACRT